MYQCVWMSKIVTCLLRFAKYNSNHGWRKPVVSPERFPASITIRRNSSWSGTSQTIRGRAMPRQSKRSHTIIQCYWSIDSLGEMRSRRYCYNPTDSWRRIHKIGLKDYLTATFDVLVCLYQGGIGGSISSDFVVSSRQRIWWKYVEVHMLLSV